MIERKTVIVLGAGASASYGLPVGSALTQMILSADSSQLQRIPTGPSEFIHDRRAETFQQEFRESFDTSIDAFLGRRRDWLAVGTSAIARLLLPCERADRLVVGSEDDWIPYLLNAMEAPWERYSDNRVSFVTFNYDRSLEFALTMALRRRYGKDETEARQMIASFPIVHVYGSMGSLDPDARDFVPYGGGGGDRIESFLHRAISDIKIIDQGRDDSAEFNRARELIIDCEALCFLGFGFDKKNVERLGGTAIGAGYRRNSTWPFAATALGTTQAEREDIARRISPREGGYQCVHRMYDQKCLAVLRQSLILG